MFVVVVGKREKYFKLALIMRRMFKSYLCAMGM
jgi:hypothetical protein